MTLTGKFAFESFVVSTEVRFPIRIPFICSESLQKVHFRLRTNHVFQ